MTRIIRTSVIYSERGEIRDMYQKASTESLELFRETMLETLTEIEAELKYRKLAEEKSSTEVPEVEGDAFVRLEAVNTILSSNTQYFRFPPNSITEVIALIAKLPKRMLGKSEGEITN